MLEVSESTSVGKTRKLGKNRHDRATRDLELDGLFTSIVLTRLVSEIAKTQPSPHIWLKGFIDGIHREVETYLPDLEGPWELESLSKEVDFLDEGVQEVLRNSAR
jgi:hypothetical protein